MLPKRSLLDLPDDALLCVAGHLQKLQHRLHLFQTCKRLYQVGTGPSPLWRVVEFRSSKKRLSRVPREDRLEAAVEISEGFARWLRPRLPSVESLCFHLHSPDALRQAPWQQIPRVPALLLAAPDGNGGLAADAAGAPALPLASLVVQWPGQLELDFAGTPQLPRLRSLTFIDSTALRVSYLSVLPQPPLEHFEVQDGPVLITPPPPTESGRSSLAWLPPSLTSLCLDSAGLADLPDVLQVQHLPRLRSLHLTGNRLRHTDLAGVKGVESVLQELNLSENHLMHIPPRIASLTSLRVLYLHNAFHRTAVIEAEQWEALRVLRRLAFLSISGNNLTALPPAVADMSHLRGLHLEENDLAGGLPLAPYLLGLRELLLDWQTALDSAPALRAATCLSRLVLSGHRAADLGGPQGVAIRPPAAAEPLLAALAAMPRLARVEDVFVGGEDVVTAPVARVMWELGSHCRHLRVGLLLQDANVGMLLADVERAEAADGAAAGPLAGAAGAAGAAPVQQW